MTDSALAFYLDAPMQAWGSSSKFQRRETESYPTKSGVLGLLSAALGIDKHSPDESAALAPLAALRYSVVKVIPADRDRPVERLSDFHTVGGGWHGAWQADKSNLRAKLSTPRKAGDSSPFGTVITRRTYLTDARFIATLEGPSDTLARCAAALEDPKWGGWFGRKCCLPATPFLPTVADSKEASIADLLEKFPTAMRPTPTQGQTESAGTGAWFQADQPTSFGQREFQSRPVQRTDRSS